MYSVVGIYIGNSVVVCPACAVDNDNLTEPEVRFLSYGFDSHWNSTMDTWPQRDKDGGIIVDDAGEVVFDEDVRLTRKMQDELYDRATAISDAEEWLDGLDCDVCSAELIEPYTIKCRDCGEVAGTGGEALEYDNKHSHIYCANCIDKHHRETIHEAKVRLEKDLGFLKYYEHLEHLASFDNVLITQEHYKKSVKETLKWGWLRALPWDFDWKQRAVEVLDECMAEDYDFDFTQEKFGEE